MKLNSVLGCLLFVFVGYAQQHSKVWQADNEDGTYTNPILHSDFSDPDVVRVGKDYYMTASSFNCVPGLPILHSNDLVNWQLVNYALKEQVPFEVFNVPQHGNGVWAPCIRYYKGEYYIFYPDPDFGIYMIKTKNPEGDWSKPLLIKPGKGLIDPTPLWDDDGKAYLAYAFAGSRAQIKSMLMVCSMKPDATAVLNDDVMVFDGHETHPTIEGPKFYKRNGYYYLFAPAGGVATGWQEVLRSKNVWGPYEYKTVLEQGNTTINGPHQGAWVDTVTGEDWFVHFQDKGAYGRIVHLQPMTWKNDWPIIGKDQGNAIGVPVKTHPKPNVGTTYSIKTPPDSDEFNGITTGLQWQWHANPKLKWGFPTSDGHYKLFCKPRPDNAESLWDIPFLFLQKWPAEKFTATTKVSFTARENGEHFGFLIMGRKYAYLKVYKENNKLFARLATCSDAEQGEEEVLSKPIAVKSGELFLKIQVENGGVCQFYLSENGKRFNQIGDSFSAEEGKWIGAKIGYFAMREGVTNDSGSLAIDYIRFTND